MVCLPRFTVRVFFFFFFDGSSSESFESATEELPRDGCTEVDCDACAEVDRDGCVEVDGDFNTAFLLRFWVFRLRSFFKKLCTFWTSRLSRNGSFCILSSTSCKVGNVLFFRRLCRNKFFMAATSTSVKRPSIGATK